MRPIIWASLALGTVAQVSDPKAFYSALRPCPASCDASGKPENWTVYTSLNRLDACDQPILLDFAIYNPLDDPNTIVKLRTCTTGDANTFHNALAPGSGNDTSMRRRHTDGIADISTVRRDSVSCLAKRETKQVNLDLAVSGDNGKAGTQNLSSALQQLEDYLSDESNCDAKFVVGYHQDAAVAIYSGASIDNSQTLPKLINNIKAQVATGSGVAPKTIITQLCGNGRNADFALGVAIDTTGDLAAVQKAVKAWSDGTCVNGTQVSSHLTGIDIVQAPIIPVMSVTNSTSTGASAKHIQARADCTTTTVVSGDSCGSLASRCGITAAQFTQYNPSSTLCSTLAVGQRVCCSSGSLPDLRPKPNPDGSCAAYTIQSGDFCGVIAATYSLQVADLSTFNDGKTWGWSGCNNLFVGIKICLSTGTPPLPAPDSNAICGPTMPNSKPPSSGQNISELNPCPLNACCNIWGQCGITPDFCDPTKGATNNPGTAPPGKNGCISNCGTSIVNNGQAPGSFINVGYYESWNWDRPCLNLRAERLGQFDYTHIHWGFATISDGFGVQVDDTYNQMPGFLANPQKKIISFGGWGYSTDPATYEALRTAMQPANAGTFAQNIVNYLNSNGLDGVDIDWEYPGAPDIPGIPPGLASDGPNYLAFLQTLRSKMPSGKTISIAAPASYWYLKAFPVAQMAQYLDYIVYMTYDLHGQWDYGNQFSQDGCPAGNCLRSHVNLTETTYALAMLTKAGVPSNKIAVGLSSYGRSFGMTTPGCPYPYCTYGGPDSTAAPGDCTDTAGYISNAEILSILDAGDNSASQFYDSSADSYIMTYSGDQWVAYMDETIKGNRKVRWQGLNFGGVVDWAADLQQFGNDDGEPTDDGTDDLPDTDPLTPCDATFDSIEALDAAADSIPLHCQIVYTLTALNNLLKVALSNYTDMINNGYDGKFNTYSKSIADSAGSLVHDFVYNNGNKYFSCIIPEASYCCSECSNTPRKCNYCFDDDKCQITCIAGVSCPTKRETGPGNGGGGSSVTIDNIKWANHTEPCPPDYSQRGAGPDNPYVQSIYWTLTNSNGFFADLAANTGIGQNKVAFKDVDRGNDCAPSSKQGDSCFNIGYDYNIPVVNGYSQSDVANPKDIVSNGLPKVQQLGPQIDSILTELSADAWFGDGYELLDAISMPIFMIAEATEQMGTVEQVADEIDAEKRKAFILAFVSAILFFVPVIGEVVGSIAELADIGTIISLLGAAGNAAQDIYTIVDDPNNAPLAIFDLVLTPLALADLSAISKAAGFRRGMAAEDVAKLGDRVNTRMGTIKKITGTCAKNDA
ncbi:glycoside hydrolase family 18 protein [Xylogone sp. PMI_703]|nr:glycoside hydrolase family 18 protein [Xylogone sp. PMI_703]